MSKYTKGPWRVGDAGFAVFGPKGNPKTIARIVHCGEEIASEENLANARLIAAVPELLEAAKLMLRSMLESDDNTRLSVGDLIRIADIINRAER